MRAFFQSLWESLFVILKLAVLIVPFAALLFFVTWQSFSFYKLERDIKQATLLKIELTKKNDELKIGIASFTSAERIENLYRKTYKYLPISVSGRIIPILLPEGKQ